MSEQVTNNENYGDIKPAKFFDFSYFFYDFVKITGIPGLLLYRPKLIYENENAKAKIKGGALLISNHVGFSDPIYLMVTIWYRRHHFICIKDFFENPKSRFWFKQFHCIPIDRENFGVNTFKLIIEHLKAGHLVSMFPEGHITEEEGNAMNSFKSGLILMALKSKKPVIPVYFAKRPHWYSRLKVVIGEPVDVVKMYGDKPKFSQIDEASKILFDKEKNLEKLCI